MTTEQQDPTTDPQEPQQASEDPQEEPEAFPADYVRELRQEAAGHRTAAKEAADKMTAIETAYRAALLREASAGILHEPLTWEDAFNDPETGLPDPERIAQAVAKTAEERPWLSRPRGDVGQGFRGQDSDAVDLASMLRAGA